MDTNLNIKEQINLFRSMFRGREDIFAKRWEKGNKNGYMPVYFFDPYRYRAHQIKGGSFKTFTEKAYLPVDDNQILKHLKGEQLIGIYPLLNDNTSWFIVADFDKANWEEACKDFMSICIQKNIPAYLERSRSGNGGHIWMFFESPYPAIKSRIIFKSLLEESGAFSVFDKTSSFDRLFPNQDFLSGKGFGNLIALPLYKPNVDLGNSCFINPKTFEPYDNQWNFLQQVKKMKSIELDNLYNSINKKDVPSSSFTSNGKLTITLNSSVHFNRSGLTLPLINFLKSTYNLPNSEYFIRKKMNKNTWNTDSFITSSQKQMIKLPFQEEQWDNCFDFVENKK